MPRFKVLVEKVVQYVVEVDAPELARAGEAALGVMHATDDVAQYLHAESGMEVAHVYKGDKMLPKTC
jgi:hypothetical protein